MMDKKRQTKFQIAVYGIVGALGIILILISLVFNWLDVWQSIWINLGTGLLGVGILFFLVDRFFLADEWRLSDKVDQLIKRLEESDRPSAEAFFTRYPELDAYLKNAIEIDLCGVTLSATLNKYFRHIQERLRNGATVRLLLADPNSLALEMSALRSDVPDDVDFFVKRLASTFKDIGYLLRPVPDDLRIGQDETIKNNLSVRLLPYASSFGLVRIKAGNGDQTMIIEIYPHRGKRGSAPVFILTPERDPHWYDYFARQFERMWAPAKPWDPQVQSEETEPGFQRRIGRVPATSFLSPRRYLPEHILADAKVICMSGFTLSMTTREYLHALELSLMAGGDIRIIILEATDALLDQCAKRSGGQTTPMHWRKRLESTESLLEVIAKTPEATGKLSLGHLPYIPSFGIIMVDPDTDHGVIFVELYHHRSWGEQPGFELRADRDGHWYRFFREQFDLMWESSRIEKLPREGNAEASATTSASVSTG